MVSVSTVNEALRHANITQKGVLQLASCAIDLAWDFLAQLVQAKGQSTAENVRMSFQTPTATHTISSSKFLVQSMVVLSVVLRASAQNDFSVNDAHVLYTNAAQALKDINAPNAINKISWPSAMDASVFIWVVSPAIYNQSAGNALIPCFTALAGPLKQMTISNGCMMMMMMTLWKYLQQLPEMKKLKKKNGMRMTTLPMMPRWILVITMMLMKLLKQKSKRLQSPTDSLYSTLNVHKTKKCRQVASNTVQCWCAQNSYAPSTSRQASKLAITTTTTTETI